MDLPFDIPHLRAENGPAQAHVRIGWLRGVANIYHAFAIQSFLDELAAAAGRDRIEFFLDVLGRPRQIDFQAEGTTNANYGKPLDQYPVDTGRLRRVVDVVAERSGWAHKQPRHGRTLGFAAHRSFLSYVAAVVEVEVDAQGRVRIPRVALAVDAGCVVHPERVQAQFEGAAVFAASVALMGEITAANGQVRQSNFHDYPVARLTEAPSETHVHLLPSDDVPAGVGEPGVPPTIPALCNALFAATGKRIRQQYRGSSQCPSSSRALLNYKARSHDGTATGEHAESKIRSRSGGEPRVAARHPIGTHLCRQLRRRLVHVGFLPGGQMWAMLS